MDDKVLIAIIAAVSALLGSLIPTVIGYLNTKKQREFDLKKDILNKQHSIYLEVMLALQGVMNRGGDQFEELQKASIKVSIFGDDMTSKAINEYYLDLVSSSQGVRSPLNREEHQQHQAQVVNCMRVAIGFKPLNRFELVAWRPKSNSVIE